MRKSGDIRTQTADEIRAMRRRGEDRTDRFKVDAMTEADPERAIAADEDERDSQALCDIRWLLIYQKSVDARMLL